MKKYKELLTELKSAFWIGDGRSYILEYNVVNTNRRNNLVYLVETFKDKPMGGFSTGTQWDDMLNKFFDFFDNNQKPVLYNTEGKIVMDKNNQKIPKKPKFTKTTGKVKEF